MPDTRMLVVYNHRHESTVDAVRSYNSRFTHDVTLAAPFRHPGVIQYSAGCRFSQTALVEYLSRREEREGYTVLVHDDLVLNPFRPLVDLVPDDGDLIRIYRTRPFGGPLGPGWFWQFRELAAWFTPHVDAFGTGIDDVAEILRGSLLYQQNREAIDAMPTSRIILDVDPMTYYEPLGAWAQRYFPGREEYDFELPLFQGNADYLVFPNSQALVVEDFLRRTLECGIHGEVAIPTLVEWLGLPVEYDRDRQELHFTMDVFADITSVTAIEDYFRARPDLISIHPVKFSRFGQAG